MNRMFLGLFLFVLAGSVSAETDTPVLSGYDEAVASLKAVPAVVAALDHVLVMEPESHKLLIELN